MIQQVQGETYVATAGNPARKIVLPCRDLEVVDTSWN